MCHQVRRIQSLVDFKSYYYSWSIATTNTSYQIKKQTSKNVSSSSKDPILDSIPGSFKIILLQLEYYHNKHLVPGYEHVVWDVSLVSDRIGSSLQHGLTGKLQLGDYLNARARTKIGIRRDYDAKNIAFAPAISSVAGKIHPEFLRLLWVLADMQTVKYFNWGRRGHREWAIQVESG